MTLRYNDVVRVMAQTAEKKRVLQRATVIIVKNLIRVTSSKNRFGVPPPGGIVVRTKKPFKSAEGES